MSSQCQDNSPKGWSNQVGYGHIVQAEVQPNGSVKAEAHPWNRIQSLPAPHNTLVDTKAAWSPPISTSLESQLTASCQSCPTPGVAPKKASYGAYEPREYAPLV